MLRFFNDSGTSFLSIVVFVFCFSFLQSVNCQNHPSDFRTIAFFKQINDSETAHLSFVHEANRWFSLMAEKYNFSYDSTTDWNNLNDNFLANYQVVIFFDARPDSPDQRTAFRRFMENGGGWLGFHFAGFALTPSDFPQNWDWYHNEFLGSGEYKGNTWRPTSAVLRVEDRMHPATKNLPETFSSSPNEWYSWKNDLRHNPDISILLSIDPVSFPLGTGPKLHEIWHEGYYPVVWSNRKYKMVYFNMGHNDIDYENKTNKELSFTFNNDFQNRLIIDALLWAGKSGTVKR
jgi:hypothetical protein